MNPKGFFIAASVCILSAMTAWGIPARPGQRTLTDPDGREYTLTLVGDEFFHRYVDSEGNAFTRDSLGYFHPAGEEDAAAAAARSQRRIPGRAFRSSGEEKLSQVKHIGDVRVPIILVQYSDVKFRDTYPRDTFERSFNDDLTSAAAYFKDQSDGQFRPRFDLYGPVTLTKPRAYYGRNLPNGGDRGIGQMVAEACVAQDSNIDFSAYDSNGDGDCDVIIILYAGDGEASSNAYNAADAIWPCQWDLETSDFGRSLELDGTKVNMFAVFNELNGENLSKIDGIGTFCHEFSHCLGLPDFYDTGYGPHFGMGYWSVMDHGGYNNSGYTPLGYSAYEKEFMGWMEIQEAEPQTEYTLYSHNSSSAPAEGKKAVRLINPADPDEYYIIEARRKRQWDMYMPAEGMLITHFTYDPEAWERNCVNDFDLQRATIIPADGELLLDRESYYGQTMYFVNQENQKGDLWPQPGATELTDSSYPAAIVNTGGFMSKPLTDISWNPTEASVTFRTGDFTPSGITAPGAEETGVEPARWYSLDGMALPGLPSEPGLYIRRQGTQITKTKIQPTI